MTIYQAQSTRVQQLFSTLAVVTASNPVLLEGEKWNEKDATTGRATGRTKTGDGVVTGTAPNQTITGTAFNSLPFDPSSGGGSGTVTSVTGIAPIAVANGTTTPAVSISAATISTAGSMSATDKTKLDSIVVDTASVVRKIVRNNSGVSIPKGSAVYQTGSSGTTLTVALADASAEATAAQTLGLAQGTIADNSTGYVVAVGLLDGINTSTLTEGQIVWLSETAGGLTTTRPTQPAHGVVCGYCIKQGAGSSGILYVKVDNGLELDELHDVLIPGSSTGQVLRKASDGLWKNHSLTVADVSGLGTLATQSGTFSGTSSGTNTGDQTIISGNAGTATRLETARTIGGSSFDGSANITAFPSPGAIGGNTPAAGSFTALSASSSFLLPDAAAGSPAAGHICRKFDAIAYQDSLNVQKLLLDSSNGTLQFRQLLSDVSNTTGDVSGSAADTGQTWTTTGDGTVSGKKAFYASDANGGYMRASELGGNVNTYVIGNLGSDTCCYLKIKHKGSMATLSFLKTSGSFNDMAHINFTQSSGVCFPRYWKTGVGIDQAFLHNELFSNPIANPDALRTYEVYIFDSTILAYTDGVLVGVIYDKVIPSIIGPGFYVQLHDANKRVYSIQASTLVNQARPTQLASESIDARIATFNNLHIGNKNSSNYAPNSDLWALANTFNINSDESPLNVTYRAVGTGQPATFNLLNGYGVGFTIVSDGSFVTSLYHQNSSRIVFNVNTLRTDFPVAIGLARLATDPTDTAIIDGGMHYSTASGRVRARVAGVFRDLATVDGWTHKIGEPTVFNASGTATVGNLLAGILTSDAAVATPVTVTLPTGASMDGGFAVLADNIAFQWSVINLDTVESVTVAAAAGHTLIGKLTVPAGESGRWASRRYGVNAWVSYRL